MNMARKTSKPKYDAVQVICDRLIAIMEEAIETGNPLPWHKPWKRGNVKYTSETISITAASDSPHNGTSGRAYSGINIWLLRSMPYASAAWGTYKQWRKAALAHLKAAGYTYDEEARTYTHPDGDDAPFGANPCPGVMRGETATTICFWKFLKGNKKDADGNVIKDAQGKPVKVTIPMLRTYKVFNIEQCGGIDPSRLPNVKPRTITIKRPDPSSTIPGLPAALADAEPVAHAMIHAHMQTHPGLSLVNGGDRACYNIGSDRISMPKLEQFDSPAQYAATLLHEFVHSTGHHTRLNREFGGRFGNNAYAFEELVAEFGAASLCALANVPSSMRDDHAPYLLAWARKLMKQDKYAPHSAIKQSRLAVAMIAGEEAISSGSYDDDSSSSNEAAAV